MLPFSDRELALLRSTQESSFPDLVTVRRKSLTSDGFGGRTTGTPTTVATNRPARITQAQAYSVGGQASRDLQIEKWTIRMPFGEDLKDEDFIDWNGITLQVEDVQPRSYGTAVTAVGEVVK